VKISLRVKTRTSQNKLIKNPAGTYTAFLTASPVDGEANASLIDLLSGEFGVAKSSVRIIKGLKSKNKIVSIGDHKWGK